MSDKPTHRERDRHARALIILAVVAALWTAHVGHAAPNPPAAARSGIRILSAWIRWLPAGLPAAGYLTLENTGDGAVSLLRVSTPAYGEVSIHRSITHGSEVEMVPVESIVVPAHTTLEFASRGYHLMLMKPANASATTAQVPMSLYFSDGSSLTARFEIRN